MTKERLKEIEQEAYGTEFQLDFEELLEYIEQLEDRLETIRDLSNGWDQDTAQ